MKNVHKHIQGCNLRKVKNCLDRGVHLNPLNNDLLELRFWCRDKLVDVQRLKVNDLGGVHF